MSDLANKPEKPAVKEEADKAIADGQDKSKGGYDALMADFSRAQQTLKPADMDAYSAKVIDGLKQSGTLGDHALTFAKENFDRLNTGGEVKDKGLDRSEVNPSKGRNALEKAFLQELTSNFSEVQDKRWFQNEKPGVITKHDLNNALEERNKPRDDRQRAAYEGDKTAMANKDVQDFSKALFSNTDGGANSLFNRLDVLDRDADGSFGKKSLEAYLRLSETDPNLPHKELVGRMLNEWDGPAMQAMRGERPEPGGRDHSQGPQYHDNVNINRLARTLGSTPDALMASGRADVPGARPARVAEAAPLPAPGREQPHRREYGLPGAPVPGRRVERDGRQPDMVPYDGNVPPPRPRVRPDVRPDDRRAQPPEPPRRPTDLPQAAPSDAQPPQAPPAKPVEVRVDPKAPDVKPDISDQDLAKTREAYAQELAKTYQERTTRKVEAGDGWDRLARRELRANGQDIAERNVVQYAEELAKMNGRAGRLDTDNILKRDQAPIKVHDDKWVQDQVKAKLDEFDKEVARRKAAAAAAAAPPADNFRDQRSGGDVQPAAVPPKPGDAQPQPAAKPADAQPQVAPKPADAQAQPAPQAGPADATPQAPVDKAAADKAAADKAAADKAAADKAAADKAAADKAAADKAAADKAAADKAAADKAAAEKAAADKAAADKAARARAAAPAAAPPNLNLTDLGPPGGS